MPGDTDTWSTGREPALHAGSNAAHATRYFIFSSAAINKRSEKPATIANEMINS
jgi:hypothetical protein